MTSLNPQPGVMLWNHVQWPSVSDLCRRKWLIHSVVFAVTVDVPTRFLAHTNSAVDTLSKISPSRLIPRQLSQKTILPS